MDNYEIYNDFDFCRPYLTGDEYIMWQGKPERGNLITHSDIFTIPFSVLWCAFAIFWVLTAYHSGAPLPFVMFGMIFVFVGCYISFGRFIHTAILRKNTAYVITNKKIIRKRSKTIDMLDGKTMPPMFIDIHKNGNGTIRFGHEPVYYGRSRTSYNAFGQSTVFTIENISDIVEVQNVINRMGK